MANTENIRKWVTALRSGEFEQARGALSKHGKYCCLGVACELAIRDGLPIEKRPCDLHGGGQTCGAAGLYDGEYAALPPTVRNWLGLEERDPKATYKGTSYKLSTLNDDGGFNFADIADVIERQWLPGETDAWYDVEASANNFVSRVRATQADINAGAQA